MPPSHTGWTKSRYYVLLGKGLVQLTGAVVCLLAALYSSCRSGQYQQCAEVPLAHDKCHSKDCFFYGDILVPANPGPPGKKAVKWRVRFYVHLGYEFTVN